MSGFKKNSQKALPPAGSKEVHPDGFHRSRTDSKKHGADSFRRLRKDIDEKADSVWKRAIDAGAEALDSHVDLMRRARAIREQIQAGEVMADEVALIELELKAIIVEDKVTSSVLTSAKAGKQIGWIKEIADSVFDAIGFEIKEVPLASGVHGTTPPIVP